MPGCARGSGRAAGRSRRRGCGRRSRGSTCRTRSGSRRASTRTRSRCAPSRGRRSDGSRSARRRLGRSRATPGRACSGSTEDGAAINRFGFNNDGAEAIAARLAARPAGRVVGLNLGANKDSADRAADFAAVLTTCGAHVDFATVNVSSPNTERLRDLQGGEALAALLAGVLAARDALPRRVPVFLKVAPDLSEAELEDVVAASRGVDAIVATNTTLDRAGLRSRHAGEAGGLSGRPLLERSTRVLARLSTLTDLPLVGVGGVSDGASAYAKIRAGASAVQLYTALVYDGPSLAGRIARDLDARLARDGFASVADAVGTDRESWL